MPDFLSPITSKRKISKGTLFVCLDDYFKKQKNTAEEIEKFMWYKEINF